jgi:hypothetical protein
VIQESDSETGEDSGSGENKENDEALSDIFRGRFFQPEALKGEVNTREGKNDQRETAKTG